MSESSISNAPAWVETIIKTHEHLDAAMRLMGSGNWYLKKMAETLKYLIDRFSPYRVGDELELSATPEITEKVAWGWLGAKHFLVEGAKCVVREVDCSEEGFRYGVVFPDQTYVHQGVTRKSSQMSVFFMKEEFLRFRRPKEEPDETAKHEVADSMMVW